MMKICFQIYLLLDSLLTASMTKIII